MVKLKLAGVALAGLAATTLLVATSDRHSHVHVAAAALSGGFATPPGGKAMPIGNLPGWRQVFAGDFRTAARTGTFPGSAYGKRWSVYPDGLPDTWHIGRQCPSKVLSVRNGVLDYYLHTVSTFDKMKNVHCVAAVLPRVPVKNQVYGRYSIRFRADPAVGYAMANLLWPDDNKWPLHGEIDFAEGRLDGTVHAFAHFANPKGGQQAFDSRKRFTGWHTATVEWAPGVETFFLDGVAFGRSRTEVPKGPMHPVLQTDTAYGTTPANTAAGHIQVAWVVVYSRANQVR